MKTNILTLITLFTTIALASCTKEIPFNGEQTDPKLVINCLVEEGQPVMARVSKSVFFLDNENTTDPPADVVATLFVNGNRIGEMMPSIDTVWEGYEYVDLDSVKPVYGTISVFVSDYRPVEGDVIKITASANGFDDVEGTASPLPQEVEWHLSNCETLYWQTDTYEGYTGDSITSIITYVQLTFDITDPNPGQTDYFRLCRDSGDHSYGDGNNSFYFSFSYDDPVFGGSVNNDYFEIDYGGGAEGVFTDQLFDGRSYSLKVKLLCNIYMDGNIDPDFFQISFNLEHLGKEYYHYLNTCEQASDIMQFFTEPVQTYNNIESGYGIIGSFSTSTILYPLPFEP